MFYKMSEGHGLPHDPFKAILAPRPIGWISTVDVHGVHNLAPYSFFGAVSSNPHMIGFSSEGLKDSVANAKTSGEFVYNVASIDLLHEMNTTSQGVAPEIDEFKLANLDSLPCSLVAPRRVAQAPASMECRVVHCTQLQGVDGKLTQRYMVIGQVLAIHIRDDLLAEGRFNTAGANLLARCGYRDYTAVEKVFELHRPSEKQGNSQGPSS
ncbi:flavin reductase family protein [Natronospirillum operosum]|uniref:Flavin reductase family protein n=1 Tax=Natronospirillum operosum TaxID=2759953 RepID=A0A4Z0WF68_9GAMM|nr:flavin reductase family protein [Natronospirillum operosum]TGG93591.1 flavin reductase family protein [Natronospirillum operosum]